MLLKMRQGVEVCDATGFERGDKAGLIKFFTPFFKPIKFLKIRLRIDYNNLYNLPGNDATIFCSSKFRMASATALLLSPLLR